MANLYQTSKESKTLEIEDTTREGFPFRLVITLRQAWRSYYARLFHKP